MKMAGKEEEKKTKKKMQVMSQVVIMVLKKYMLYNWIDTYNFYSRKLLNLQIYKFMNLELRK